MMRWNPLLCAMLACVGMVSISLGQNLTRDHASDQNAPIQRATAGLKPVTAGPLPARIFLVPFGMDPSTIPTGVSFPVPVTGGEFVPIDVFIEDSSGSGFPLESYDVGFACMTPPSGPPAPPVTSVSGSAFVDEFHPMYVFDGQGSVVDFDPGQCETDEACTPGSCPPPSTCVGGFCEVTSPSVSAFTSPPVPVFGIPRYLGSFFIEVPIGASGDYEIRPVCCPGDANCDTAPDGGCGMLRTVLNTAFEPAIVDGLLLTVSSCACDGDIDDSTTITGADIACVFSALGDEGLCPGSDVNCDGSVDLLDVEAVSCQFDTFAGNTDCCLPVAPTGACCFAGNSQCSLGDPVSCSSPLVGDGVYLGDGTDCDLNPCPQPNDDCADAIALAVPGTVMGDNAGGTDSGQGTCVTTEPNQSLWYSVTGNGETFTATTCNDGTDFDTVIQVWCRDCNDLVCVTGNDDTLGGPDLACEITADPGLNRKSTVTWCTAPGQEYFIAVGGLSGAGDFEISTSSDGMACADPVACTIPTGACCTGVTCTIETEGACTSGGGNYLGDGTTCAGDPCGGGGMDTIAPFQTVTISPAAGGGAVNPRVHGYMRFANMTASSGMLTVDESESNLHPGAGGQPTFGETLSVETTIAEGQFKLLVSIPFHRAELAGDSPLSPIVTVFDDPSNTWDLTVEKNVSISLGHTGVVGDKIIHIGSPSPTINELFAFDIGDYGVFWDPDTQSGFAWAIQDHTSDNRNGRGPRRKSCETDADCVLISRDVCTHHMCVDSICEGFPVRYGDIRPPYANLVQTNDILAAVEGFGDYLGEPNADINAQPFQDCAPSGIPINTRDILETVSAFGGADPCGCGNPNPPIASSTVDYSRFSEDQFDWANDEGTLEVRVRQKTIAAGEVVDVDLFLFGVPHVMGIQSAIKIASEGKGELVLESIRVDDRKLAKAFGDMPKIVATDDQNGRLSVVFTDGMAPSLNEKTAYVGTFRFRASADASGMFHVGLNDDYVEIWQDTRLRVHHVSRNRATVSVVSSSK